MKNIIIKAATSAFMFLSLSSCSDWLQVEMEDKIMEPVLFSNYPGYVSAINGVYLSLNDYYTGANLMNILDVMAQYYDVTENTSHTYKTYMAFDYNDGGFESKNSALWNQAYTIIANTNAILDHLQDIGDTPLNQTQYNILRGECLAMRAMLHFDLLRRHGSIYAVDPNASTIPYQGDTSREIQPFLTHKEVMDRIFADLNEAAALLKNSDPIITDGTRDTTTEDNGVSSYDMSFRNLRLNYYAVQGLLARAYMWVGDKTNAYRTAKNEIIDKITTDNLEVFPWVKKEQVEAENRNNLIFSPEIMFAMYNSDRPKLNANNFASTLQLSQRLTFYGETLGESKVIAIYDNDNDYRRIQWNVVEPTQAEIDKAAEEGREPKSSLYTTKFADFGNTVSSSEPLTYRFMVPMIRLSEIYFIAAEATNDRTEAYELINTVRLHRQCPDLPSEGVLDTDLTYEYNREMIGEGQLFFFYKRRQETMLISRTGSYDFNMSLSAYVWPIPEDEMNKRTEIGKK